MLRISWMNPESHFFSTPLEFAQLFLKLFFGGCKQEHVVSKSHVCEAMVVALLDPAVLCMCCEPGTLGGPLLRAFLLRGAVPSYQVAVRPSALQETTYSISVPVARHGCTQRSPLGRESSVSPQEHATDLAWQDFSHAFVHGLVHLQQFVVDVFLCSYPL